jgi:hypothetical protein
VNTSSLEVIRETSAMVRAILMGGVHYNMLQSTTQSITDHCDIVLVEYGLGAGFITRRHWVPSISMLFPSIACPPRHKHTSNDIGILEVKLQGATYVTSVRKMIILADL